MPEGRGSDRTFSGDGSTIKCHLFFLCCPSVGLTLSSILSLSINLAKAEGPCSGVLLKTSPSHPPATASSSKAASTLGNSEHQHTSSNHGQTTQSAILGTNHVHVQTHRSHGWVLQPACMGSNLIRPEQVTQPQ